MSAPNVPQLLLKGLLDGVEVVFAGGEGTLWAGCAALGAQVGGLEADLLDEDAVLAAAQALRAPSVLICETGPALRAAGADPGALDSAVAGAWNATRAVFSARLEPAGGGLVVLIAPRPADGPLAGAAGAALENLARTTSVEWARLGVRVLTVRPRDITADAALADLVAYLASPAGAYFSGCVLDLGAAGLTGYRSSS